MCLDSTMDKTQEQPGSQLCMRSFAIPLLLPSVAAFLALTLGLLTLAPCTQGINVNVAVLLPFDDSYLFSYHRVAPAMELAIAKLNRNTRLLRRHRIIVRFNDSSCNIAFAIDKAITFFMNHEVDVFFGPVCDFAVAPVARQTRFWNVPVVSVGAMALDFASSRLKMYPLLTRVGPVHFGHLSRFFATLSRRYQWRKIKLLYSKEGQDYLIKSFCHLAAEALIYTWDDIEPDLDKDYFKMHARQTREEARSVLVDEVGLKYGGRDS